MNAVVALGATGGKIAELRSRLALVVLRVQDLDLYHPDEILDDLLAATVIAIELAGLRRDEPERCALYDCLRDYCETPARLVEVERLAGGGILA